MHDDTRALDRLEGDAATLAGHKARTLGRLLQSGFPVPDGFVVLPSAFKGDVVREEAWAQIQEMLERLRRQEPGAAFAVRSSALAEDSPQASYAGAFETILGARDDNEVRSAIITVRRSRHAERVLAYHTGLEPCDGYTTKAATDLEMAVLVQRLVRADLSGVLFTADPVTGDRSRMIGNATHGLGHRLVSGEESPMQFALAPQKRWLGIKTQASFDGPPELRPYADRLYRLGKELEQELGGQQDIEWAVANDRLFLLQSRPITTLSRFDSRTGEFNDSLVGDYVWSCVNLGEAVSVVMTPLTWSVMRAGFAELDILPGHPSVGNIGGRLYQNSTVMVSVLHALGKDFVDIAKEMGGVRDEYLETMDQYLKPLPDATLLGVLPKALRVRWREKRALRREAGFLARNPDWCLLMRQRIQAIHAAGQLAKLMETEILPRCLEVFWRTYATALRYIERVGPLRRSLVTMIGAAEADMLLSSVSGSSEMLASLGPMVGFAKVARGEMSRDDFLERWGHRGELETEISAPRPAEDPSWLDRQLDAFLKAPVDVEALLADKRAQHLAAWDRFRANHPRQIRSVRRSLDAASAAARAREEIRSESARILWVVRAWAIRAGDVTGIGDGAFFLMFDELSDLLVGKGAPIATIPARRETYRRYKALPPFPLVIRGRFEPFTWADDPVRDSSVFDSHGLLPTLAVVPPDENLILGVPASAGCAEGTVRCIDSPEAGIKLQTGEVLVASQTNIGWTLFFPRAAAIVTDVGAPLSHAAIVARELGIPAVVNCGDATTRLHTGDRVRVDGIQGVIEILERVNCERPRHAE